MKRERANLYYLAFMYVTFLFTMFGCATSGKSVGLGGAIGAGSGAILGGIADPGKDGEYRTRNVVIGAGVGGVLGMVAGRVAHKELERKRKEGFEAGKAEAPPDEITDNPTLIPAKWRMEVIPTKRVGNRLIPKHVEYIITDPARWDEN